MTLGINDSMVSPLAAMALRGGLFAINYSIEAGGDRIQEKMKFLK